MQYREFIDTVQNNAPFATGVLVSRGIVFFNTPYFYRASYDINAVPYIVYNEEGTIFTQKNKGFISVRTVGAIMRKEWADALGIQIGNEREQQTELANKRKQILLSQGVYARVI